MKILSLFFGTLFFTPLIWSQTSLVYVLELKDEIHPSSSRYIDRGIDAAEKAGANLVLIHMNTYGGMVQYADSIRSRIMDCKIPTAVFIDKNAASAGALIAISCDSIFMTPGSSIGAATVVNGGTGEAMPDKYQSYMRATMRATAERKGRNPAIAEKMVDQNLEIPGLSEKGTVITFTPSEAMLHGFADTILNSREEVINHMGQSGATVIVYENTWLEGLIQFLINPAVSGILVMLIFGGIFMEFKAPGFGFPGIVAIVAAVIFFAPHYLEGLAQSWEILIFLAGITLIALEIFVVPGFGVTGVTGIVFAISGLAIALIRNDVFDFTYVYFNDALRSFAIVMAAMATSIIGVVWLAKFVTSSENKRVAYPFVDNSTQEKSEGYDTVRPEIAEMVGKEGITLTDLKPSGFVEIDGKRVDAESEGSFIEKGTQVRVLSMRNLSLLVRRI